MKNPTTPIAIALGAAGLLGAIASVVADLVGADSKIANLVALTGGTLVFIALVIWHVGERMNETRNTLAEPDPWLG
ncbi:hypothetical protein ACFVAJ_19155 [Agromyces sp. NPDC057679]|uniref:hypothetical protein n=1 Tax=Agromyces sp. NPDC057679 TaxID=3346207 RepID=UPI003671EB3F